MLERGVVQRPHAGEARVVPVDRVGEGRLASAGRHGQARDGHPVADPDRRVAGEEQVGQRGDDEVVRVHHRVDEAAGRSAAAAYLLVREPGREDGGEGLGVQSGHVVGDPAAQCVADPPVVEGGGDQLGARLGYGQRLGEQPSKVEDLDAAGAQGLGEGVVLLLSAPDPGNPVEEEGVVVAWRQTRQLRPRTMQQDGCQSADFTVYVWGHSRSVGRAGARCGKSM
jgi:hypothetical protein